jgi:hypothetical protein
LFDVLFKAEWTTEDEYKLGPSWNMATMGADCSEPKLNHEPGGVASELPLETKFTLMK